MNRIPPPFSYTSDQDQISLAGWWIGDLTRRDLPCAPYCLLVRGLGFVTDVTEFHGIYNQNAIN